MLIIGMIPVMCHRRTTISMTVDQSSNFCSCCSVLQRYRLTPDDAIDFLERKRPQIMMNKWQRATIDTFHQHLLHKKSWPACTVHCVEWRLLVFVCVAVINPLQKSFSSHFDHTTTYQFLLVFMHSTIFTVIIVFCFVIETNECEYCTCNH